MERFALIARLEPGGRERALELIAQHEAGQYVATEFERQSIFLAEGEVVFVFEAPSAREKLRSILNDPVRSTELSHWLALFDGPLHAAPEAYHWERPQG